MALSRSRSTGVITTSVKLSRWVSAGVCFMSVKSMTSPAQARKLVEQRLLDVVALVEAERLT